MVLENNPLPRHPVQVRSEDAASLEPYIVVTQIVCHDEDDVGLSRRGGGEVDEEEEEEREVLQWHSPQFISALSGGQHY